MENAIVSTLAHSLEGYLTRKVVGCETSDALARQLSMLFSMTGNDCTPGELDVFDRIFSRLIDNAEVDTRGFLSVQFSVMTNAPRTTLLRLARDVIVVARPILIHSPALTEGDLVGILKETGLGHMGAVAERADLTMTISDIIVERGDDAARRVLAANHGAQISVGGYRRLSLQARHDERLESVLIDRNDVPELVVRFLVRHGQGLARRRLDGTGADGTDADRGPVRSPDLWAAMYDFDAAEVRVAALAEQGLRGEALLLRMIAEERFAEAAIVLSHLTAVRRGDLVGWLTSPDPGPFLRAAKTLPLEVRTVFALLGMGPWRQMLDGRARQEAVRGYQALAPEAARAWLAAWRRRQAGTLPH
jgi:hypothetical protein